MECSGYSVHGTEETQEWDDSDPIHAVQAASFEDYKHPEDPLPESVTESLRTHGKKAVVDVSNMSRVSTEHDVVYN
jgi:hypothetical protein